MNNLMKTILTVSILVAGSYLMANFVPNAEPSITTVEQANKAKDGTYVTLTGKITDKIGRHEYTFSDSTGKTSVVISERTWRGINVTPQSTVTISGKVDRNFWNLVGICSNPEIEVSRISVPDDQNVTGSEERRHRPLRNALESMDSNL